MTPGTRVRLIRTTDIYTDLRPGAVGTVASIDDAGTVHIRWDSGSRLGLIPYLGDRFDIIICAYSVACRNPATALIDMPALGSIEICGPCRDLYDRLSPQATEASDG